jgi:hypothetical protein
VYYGQATAASAVAVVARRPLERMVVNFLAKFNRIRVPIRLFDDEPSARAWLEQFLPGENLTSD